MSLALHYDKDLDKSLRGARSDASERSHDGDIVRLGVIEQKQALQRVLEDRFDEITVNHPFDWLVVPEIHAECDFVRRLRERLASHRDFDDFSTPGRALRCDFYIPRANLIIEYDERQHFTEPRALTLELYPSSYLLGSMPGGG